MVKDELYHFLTQKVGVSDTVPKSRMGNAPGDA
jgi:hypothetical protein